METTRPCGCKGIRTCLLCEKDCGIIKQNISFPKDIKTYVYCPWCDKAWEGWDIDIYKEHPNHSGNAIEFPGIYIQLDFITHEEERKLLKGIDEMAWDLSQSGRRKQNFGPKCNFKKQRIKLGDFNGFPVFTKFVQEKFNEVPLLQGYRTIEQCSLEYDPLRGASIDPHIDDCWIWGERIVTVNLLSDCTLTMSRYTGDHNRYNLKCVSMYPRILSDRGTVIYNPCLSMEGIDINKGCYEVRHSLKDENWPVVRIPMPRRSLLVIYGSARYDWEHQVIREDVLERRICLAYREFTPSYLEGGKYEESANTILRNAGNFWDHLTVN